MRPVRIEAEGFSAYRSTVVLPLAGVEFFSLSGATGAGKSSLIDAMIFALYGRVPRLGGNAVAPAISAGAETARVFLEFEVDGTLYTVVRRADRTKTGATVREARLEQGSSVLADGADRVTEAVEDLLKLRFEDFTKTVVLPQGEFAEFLNAPRADRQTLLRNLLGLGVYKTMRSLATTRAAVANDRSGVARSALGAIDQPSPEEMKMAASRLSKLEDLASTVAILEKSLVEVESQVGRSQENLDSLQQALDRLEAISPPKKLDELDGWTIAARDNIETLGERLDTAVTDLEAHRQSRSSLPSSGEINHFRSMHRDLRELEEKMSGNQTADLIDVVEQAEARVADAETAHEETRKQIETARLSHAAHGLAGELVVGEPCPVCLHPVEELPSVETPAELADLEIVLAKVAAERTEARSALDQSRSRLSRVEATFAEQLIQRDKLRLDMATIPKLEELDSMETELRRLTEAIVAGEQLVERLRSELRTEEKNLEDLVDKVRRVDKDLTAAQLGVADLQPPLSDSDDVIVRWKDLISWRDETRVRIDRDVTKAQRDHDQLLVDARAARGALETALETLDVPVVEPFSAQVASAVERARQKSLDNKNLLIRVEELEADVKSSESEAALANSLANHLKANGFEQWLMAGALADLVAGANGLLGQLSQGGYSLRSDEDGSFSIVDHRNADETRSVTTLSGGETFLVSLALALSLAETLASAGGAHLDAIILDEGFGTLDEESLATVGGVLEELASNGLMVGVITHVKDLAMRAHTRFEVHTDPTGSKVELVI